MSSIVPWWKSRIVYQVYPRSFCDSNNYGTGDIPGIISKLDYLANLGIGIIWLSPVYRSPNEDTGYDISGYREINPEYGTMNDMKQLIAEAKKRNIKIVMDLVINHTSDEHPWFIESRKSTDNPYRNYYIWRPGTVTKSGRRRPPNNWNSFFTGPAWTYDETTGEYYLHLFSKKQPDLNFHNPDVIAAVKDIMRFWLDLGISGFRCDVINIIYKTSLQNGRKRIALTGQEWYHCQEGCHKILAELNKDVLSKYDCFTVGETVMVSTRQAQEFCTAEPKELARQEFEGDFQINVDSWEGDKMNPDRSWVNLMQENPLSEEFLERVRAVDGVEEVKVKTYLTGTLADLDPEREITRASIQGLDESYQKIMQDCQVQGQITYGELQEGDKILMSSDMLRWFPELKQGDAVRMELDTPAGTVEKTFEIAAVGDYSNAISWANFLLPASVLDELTDANLNDTCVIWLEKGLNKEERQEALTALENLAKGDPYLASDSYEKHLENWETATTIMMVLGYAFLIILGAVGVMNLINTMINSIYTRRRELGIIQAIGMSQKQLVRMMQLEGLFYTAGTLMVSLGIGSLAGYGVFLYAKAEHMMNITVYHFPVIPAVILAVAVAVIQMILTYAVSWNFRKMSLIDRVRYAE